MARKRSNRTFTDEDRAAALAALDANGGNVSHTARQLDIPRKTLEGWAKGIVTPPPPELRQQKKGDLADSLAELADKLAGGITNKIGDASLQAMAVALGIVIDKYLLLKGLPTTISKTADAEFDLSRLSVDELRHFRDLYDRSAVPSGSGPLNGEHRPVEAESG